MEGHPRHDAVAAAVGEIDRLSPGEARSQLSAMAGTGWPGRVEDRLERGAVDWLRRWAPSRTTPGLVATCACAAGHCGVCN
jgi:hypothetical protein